MVLCGSSPVVGTDDAGAAVPEHHCANSAEITFEACRSKRARTEGASRAATSSSCALSEVCLQVGVFSTQLLDGAVCLYRAYLLRSPEFDRQQRAARVRYAAIQKSCFFRSLSYACGDLRWLRECVVGARGGRPMCVLGDAGDFAVLCLCVCVCVCVCVTPSSLCLFWTHAVARGYTPFVCADARLLHFAFAVCAVAVRFLVSICRGVCVL